MPSGAIATDVPARSFSTTGSSAERACALSLRSINAMSVNSAMGANRGSRAASFLATPVTSRRSTLPTISTSSEL